MPSSNNLIIKSLIETLKRNPKPELVYDLATRMNADLNAAYNVVFDGPLNAVDGFLLTRLNAAVLEGELPPGFRIAYLDDLNAFTRGQLIVNNDDEEPFLQFGFGNETDPAAPIVPSSYFRVGSFTDGEFFLSQNAFFDGAAFDQDDTLIDSLILHFAGGELALEWWDSVLGDFRNTWTVAGPEILCGNFDDDAQLSFVIKDENDVFRLGEDCATDGIEVHGYIAIPAKVVTQIPPSGDANADGIIVINKTTNRIVFYHSGLRYYVQGTAF